MVHSQEVEIKRDNKIHTKLGYRPSTKYGRGFEFYVTLIEVDTEKTLASYWIYEKFRVKSLFFWIKNQDIDYIISLVLGDKECLKLFQLAKYFCFSFLCYKDRSKAVIKTEEFILSRL